MKWITELQQFRDSGANTKWIKNVLAKFERRQTEMISLHGRYQGEAPIFSYRPKVRNEFNNHLNHDYFSEITNMKTGFFAGSPIGYNIDGGTDKEKKLIERFNIDNSVADLDAETTKWAANTGYAARLLWQETDVDGLREREMIVPSYEAILLSERSISEPEVAVRILFRQESRSLRRDVEIYDNATVEYWKETKKNTWELVPDETTPHPFGVCPLYGIPNNEELLGDAEKVLSLIDDIDRTASNLSSEIEAFRQAYMVFENGDIDEEILAKAAQLGAFTTPVDGKITFLTKDIKNQTIEESIARLEAAIYRFSGTPNLSDEAFSGNSSGVALKFKLFALETKTKAFERKFEKAQRHKFRALANVWKTRAIAQLDPLDVFMEFKRNFPQDLLHEAEILEKLGGKVSQETALGLMSFIDSVDYEQERIVEEAQNSAYNGLSSFDTPTQPEQQTNAQTGAQEPTTAQ